MYVWCLNVSGSYVMNILNAALCTMETAGILYTSCKIYSTFIIISLVRDSRLSGNCLYLYMTINCHILFFDQIDIILCENTQFYVGLLWRL